MYDYMKALQRQFETKPRSILELAEESLYSFAKEEEEQARQSTRSQDEGGAGDGSQIKE